MSAGRTSARSVKERVGFFNKCADPEKYSKGGGGGGGEEYFCLPGYSRSNVCDFTM